MFAWSHFWWAISYPLAGWLGSNFAFAEFFYGSLVGLGLLAVVQITLAPRYRDREHLHFPITHEHEHIHDEYHQHEHEAGVLESEPHTHVHQHNTQGY